ncbi:PucR family transcriptional regulator [Citricoccus sp. GCM10030269]|uniref:PucR family transcriptional regulator n=1 Tax=Citricoccus sp. GCM10030269 TaxID=3273388 RepID=UPI003614D86E
MSEVRLNPPPRQVSAESLRRLRAHLGMLNTATLQRLDSTLPWYRKLTPDERSSLGLIAQRGLTGFLSWFERPSTTMSTVLGEVFGGTPTELTRSISLQRALQLIRTVVDVVEAQVPGIVQDHDQALVREAVLRYSREIAFALADVYARAAETRGAWDSRNEAVLLDAVLRGEAPDEILSRAAASGWKGGKGVMVMAGSTPSVELPTRLAGVRRTANRAGHDLLAGVQSERFVLVVGSVTDPSQTATALTAWFGEGAVVYGPLSDSLVDAHRSGREALAGLAAAPAWPRVPRPAHAQDLLPERSLQGDQAAIEILVHRVFVPLQAAGNSLLETVDTYCELGHSLEATARELFVHANTVRYRLRRVSEVTGWDPLVARDAYVLQTALAVGRLRPVRRED